MARLKGKAEEIQGNLEQKYWVQKSERDTFQPVSY